MDKPCNHADFINPEDYVKVTQMNHIIEIQHMQKMNTKNHILKLDKDHYLDLRTGAIEEFIHSENRGENYNSLRQTFKRLRYLINNGFTGKGNELHVILTYAENMTDTDRLYKDFEKFMKKLRYKFKDRTTIDYISVVEPQGRGAWHCHVLIRFNQLEKVYIKNKDLSEMWGQGFVKIKSLKNIDNIGAYLSAYLTDVELNEETVVTLIKEKLALHEKVVNGETKRFIKGGRLHMYPPGMNIYRKSKGIVEPDRQMMKFKKAKKIVGSAQPHYSKSYKIETEEFSNTITFIQYNLKRQEKEQE